jgi:Type II secretion system (T2SS), protein F
MEVSVWAEALASGAAAALLGRLRILTGRRVRARARSAGMPLGRPRPRLWPRPRLRARGRHRGPEPIRGRPEHGRRRAPAGGRPGLPPWVLRGGAALLIGAGVAVALGGVPGLVAGTLAALVGFRCLPDPPSPEQRRATAEAAALRAQLPLTADLLAGCLASWCAPATAAEAVAGVVGEPMAGRLAEAAADLRMGCDAEESWARFAEDQVLAPLGRCLVRASASGAPPAAGLARLAEGCRAEAATAAQGRARRAGVLATAPLGLCFLPAFVLIGVVPVVTGLAGSFLIHG